MKDRERELCLKDTLRERKRERKREREREREREILLWHGRSLKPGVANK